mmetsp:Transcript_6525/g.7281  ORF Transcript_6525/g.7281 Transcript_6525/m.7281 type:complete len:142 (-) Transcript_6525:88-513(-)
MFGSLTNSQLKSIKSDPLPSKVRKSKRGINFDVLAGYPYRIVDNPNLLEKSRKLYICKFTGCNKIFKKTWNLVYHFRVHLKVTPYQCSSCGKKFTQKANYERHLIVHDTRPNSEREKHECNFCPRKYSSIYNLNAHVKRDH